jgi:hypothetical protein
MSMSAQSAASVLQRAFAALLVVVLLARPLELLAAAPVAPPAAALLAPQPGMLQITILDGEGALNNIREPAPHASPSSKCRMKTTSRSPAR